MVKGRKGTPREDWNMMERRRGWKHSARRSREDAARAARKAHERGKALYARRRESVRPPLKEPSFDFYENYMKERKDRKPSSIKDYIGKNIRASISREESAMKKRNDESRGRELYWKKKKNPSFDFYENYQKEQKEFQRKKRTHERNKKPKTRTKAYA